MIVIPYDPILFDAYCEAINMPDDKKNKLIERYRHEGPPKCNSERMLIGQLYLNIQNNLEVKELNEYIENLQSKILEQQKIICEYEQMIEAAETLGS